MLVVRRESLCEALGEMVQRRVSSLGDVVRRLALNFCQGILRFQRNNL